MQNQSSVTKKALWAGYLFFFLSGATALIYEVIWLRLLGHAFGNTTYAISTVLAAYMAGLGLGSWGVGRFADRWHKPLFAYGCLEIGIGVYAALTLVLIQVIQTSYIAFAHTVDSAAPGLVACARLALSSLMVFIPTFFMGATLPVLAKFYIRRREGVGPGIAALYGVNTAGATAGTLLAGFWLLPALGTRDTLTITVGGNLAIGVLACALSHHCEGAEGARSNLPAEEIASSSAKEHGGLLAMTAGHHWLLAGLFISGAVAMLYEVAWTRLLAVVLGSSTYAFTIMLATFLLGLAIGSAVYKRILSTRPARFSEWGWLQLIIAGSALLTLPFYEQISILTVRLFALTIDQPAFLEIGRLAVCGALMFVPTLCFGALFPLSAALYAQDASVIGRDVGRLYLWNTLGNIAGSLGAGFALIPLVGIHKTILAAAVLGIFVGLAALLGAFKDPVKRLSAVALSAAVLLLGLFTNRPGWDPRVLTSGLYIRPHGTAAKSTTEILSWLYDVQNLYYREGLNAVVSVGQNGDHRFLKVNGKTDASTGLDMSTQLLSGHLPHLFHRDPKRTLIIGFGSGTTLAAALAHPIDKADSVEIEQAVLDAAPFFDGINRKAYEDPRVKLFTNDGRNHLLVHKENYDVIISEPSNPWMSGTASLFTVEFYELARKRLAEDGVLCQWLQAYAIAPEDFRMVVASVHKIFPHVMLWQSLPGDILILASGKPLTLDLTLAEERYRRSPEFRADLARLGLTGPHGILSFFNLGPEDVKRYVEGAVKAAAGRARLHRDNELTLEYTAPKALYEQGTSETIFKILGRHRTENLPLLLTENWSPDEHLEAILQIGEGHLAGQNSEGANKAKTFFEKALEASSENPRALAGLGRAYLQEGKTLVAMSYFQKAASQDPPSATGLGYLGLTYLNGGSPRKAIEHLEQATRIDPANEDFFLWKARAAEELGEWKSAAEDYLKARELKPKNLDLEIAYARSLRKAENPQEAIRLLESLRRDYTTHGPLFTELRLAYEATGDLASAILAYEDLVRLNPYWHPYWLDLIKLYERTGAQKKIPWATAQGRKTHPYFSELLKIRR